MVKTNVLRLLEAAGIACEPLYYDLGEAEFSGEAVRDSLGLEEGRSFKTLCAKGESGRALVFVVPVEASLDLKKAAKAAGEKKLALLPLKELRDLTGYERGAVSPVGMKKLYPTFIDETAILFDTIAVSAGAKGVSVFVAPEELRAFVAAQFADITEQ
ncbi:MAG TPA: YbaK/EbsC family protein [Terriglobales bacterium]|nr:YbaK/EbsC family protein [Terriglobales bacterium]